MKRHYLTECAPGQTPAASASTLSLHGAYTARVTLTGHGPALRFAPMNSSVLLGMAQVFVGPRGDAASISPGGQNALRVGPDGRLTVDDVTGTVCNTDFSNIYQLSK
jgi:hypothetical protein